MTNPEYRAHISKAIAVLTAWNDDPGGLAQGFTGGIAASFVVEEEGTATLLDGMISLAGVLLIRLEEITRVSVGDILEELAREYEEL